MVNWSHTKSQEGGRGPVAESQEVACKGTGDGASVLPGGLSALEWAPTSN